MVKFTARRIFHLTQALLLHRLRVRARDVSLVVTVVLVVAEEVVATRKRTRTSFCLVPDINPDRFSCRDFLLNGFSGGQVFANHGIIHYIYGLKPWGGNTAVAECNTDKLLLL